MGGRAMIDWIHAGPTMTAAFLGSLVECVEAVTIVLAVGTVRGWRSALLGTAGGRRGPRAPLGLFRAGPRGLLPPPPPPGLRGSVPLFLLGWVREGAVPGGGGLA